MPPLTVPTLPPTLEPAEVMPPFTVPAPRDFHPLTGADAAVDGLDGAHRHRHRA
jgi:hypothetical protein